MRMSCSANMFLIGLGDEVMLVPRAPPANLGLPVEEMDLEIEQLQSLQKLEALCDDAGAEALPGVWIPFRRKFTGDYTTASAAKTTHNLSSISNLNRVPKENRAEWYRGFELMLLAKLQSKLKDCLVKYKKSVEEYQVAKVSVPC